MAHGKHKLRGDNCRFCTEHNKPAGIELNNCCAKIQSINYCRMHGFICIYCIQELLATGCSMTMSHSKEPGMILIMQMLCNPFQKSTKLCPF